MLFASGDQVRILPGVDRGYIVKLHETIHVEEDPTNTCQNYPNNQFDSYRECDDRHLMEKTLGLVPVWATDNLSQVTAEPTFLPGDPILLPVDLYDGSEVSLCALPCPSSPLTPGYTLTNRVVIQQSSSPLSRT